jgi:asparagine synthase (glutamine-hydrolysing)
MSGIVGALALGNRDWHVTEHYLTAMRDTMVHRGPDGAGTWIGPEGRIGLAHRQLSAEKTSPTVSQPLTSENGTLSISFDGEIYNRAEIWSDLQVPDQETDTSELSDAQVVLWAFQKWGIGCVDRFNGMFAFGLWDARAGQLWLVRDRLGIKPLYYSLHNGRITFASEIKALLGDPEQHRSVNEQALFDYLSFLATPAPQTFFQGINKLPNGTWLRVGLGGDTQEHRYWDHLDHQQSLVGLSDEAVVNLVLTDLKRAIDLRASGNDPICAWSSAGIDSGIITALLAEKQNFATFTYSFDGGSDLQRLETDAASAMGKALGYETYSHPITFDDTVNVLPHIVWLLDEPIGDPNCIAFYATAKFAREEGFPACQTGIGADELFMGKEHTPVLLRLAKLNDWPLGRLPKKLGLIGLRSAGKGHSWPYERLRRAAGGDPVIWVGDECFSDAQKRRLLSERLKTSLRHYSSYESVRPLRERFEEKADPKDHFSWLTYADLNLKVPEWFLMRSDKMGMGGSHELRSPFLDHKFVELATGIPVEVHRRSGIKKDVLQKIANRLLPGELGELIVRSENRLFPYEWLWGKLGHMVQSELHEFCRQTDFLDGGEVAKFVAEMQTSREVHKARQCWALLNIALWWKAYVS